MARGDWLQKVQRITLKEEQTISTMHCTIKLEEIKAFCDQFILCLLTAQDIENNRAFVGLNRLI